MASQFVPMPDGSWAQQVATGGGGEVTVNSNSIIPVDIQNRLASTIQTHNAVSIPLSSNSLNSTWIDTDGFTDIAITILNDGATSSSADLYWSNDGSATHGIDYLTVPSSTNRYRANLTQLKARYVKLNVINGDGAAAHTMSAWIMLKA